MSYSVGDVVMVKTTGEMVFVLTEPKLITPNEALGERECVLVRRPIITDDGVKHVISEFMMDELVPIETYINYETTVNTMKLVAQKRIFEAKVRELEVEDEEELRKKRKESGLHLVN
jgi:hypothetical protein